MTLKWHLISKIRERAVLQFLYSEGLQPLCSGEEGTKNVELYIVLYTKVCW